MQKVVSEHISWSRLCGITPDATPFTWTLDKKNSNLICGFLLECRCPLLPTNQPMLQSTSVLLLTMFVRWPQRTHLLTVISNGIKYHAAKLKLSQMCSDNLSYWVNGHQMSSRALQWFDWTGNSHCRCWADNLQQLCSITASRWYGPRSMRNVSWALLKLNFQKKSVCPAQRW